MPDILTETLNYQDSKAKRDHDFKSIFSNF